MSENNIEIEELKNSLKFALHEVAVPLEKIDFTRENYNKLFPYSKVNSPIGTVKLGANQFEKLEKKERQDILQAVHDTLATPDVIINEEKEDVFGDKENSHLYAKSYSIGEKIHGIQSVVVSIDGENVSISTHERDINNIVNKIKKPDQLLYAAAKVRLLAERATGKRLLTVNPNRDNKYVASPISNITQNQTLSTSDNQTEFGAKRKIYLSGKITGDEGFAEKFKAKEEELSSRGDYVFNPALHPDMFTHGQFMQIDLLALSFCDSIYLMDNWRDSKGAKMEFEQARVMGLPCEFEEKELCLLQHYESGKDETPLYYSNQKDEFVELENITVDDFFDNKRHAEDKVWASLDWDNGNVKVVSASDVFGKNKNISFEQQKDILEKVISPEEIENIVSESKLNGSFMKAPDGSETSLSEPEWIYLHSSKGKENLKDWEYLAAYKYATEGEPVAKLAGSEFQKFDGESLVDRVLTYYTDIFNNKASRIEVGKVILDRKGIRDSLGHGMGREKAAAFAAVPEIIKKGIIFDRQKNWKNRNYDTCVLIAPIEMAGKKFAEEVILRRDSLSNKFYLYEVEIKEKLQELFKTPTEGCSTRSYLIIAQHMEKIKNCAVSISESFEPNQKDILNAMKRNMEERSKYTNKRRLDVKTKAELNNSASTATGRFIANIQRLIRRNPEMSDKSILSITAKELSDSYTADEKKEISAVLKKLNANSDKELVNVLKNTDPISVDKIAKEREEKSNRKTRTEKEIER